MLTFSLPDRFTPGNSHTLDIDGHLLCFDEENYPCAVTDSKTGFTIDYGANVFVHTIEDSLGNEDLGRIIADLRKLALELPEMYPAPPNKIISVTHLGLARLAMKFGFICFEPDPGFISTEYKDLMKRVSEEMLKRGVSIPNLAMRVLYMPTHSLFETYGRPSYPTGEQISSLSKRSRQISAQFKLGLTTMNNLDL